MVVPSPLTLTEIASECAESVAAPRAAHVTRMKADLNVHENNSDMSYLENQERENSLPFSIHGQGNILHEMKANQGESTDDDCQYRDEFASKRHGGPLSYWKSK
jgi:hypothetical protein